MCWDVDCALFSAEFPALVVKASGLAAGKGVTVAKNKDEACQAAVDMLQVTTYLYLYSLSHSLWISYFFSVVCMFNVNNYYQS